MPYDQYTLGGITSDIQSLISDTVGVYWNVAEIQFGIFEFLREWSAMTGYWRQQVAFTLPTGNSNPWIDLSVQFPAQRPRTVTVNSICQEIQYHLCELANGSSGAGMTGQYSIGVNAKYKGSIVSTATVVVVEPGGKQTPSVTLPIA